MKYITTIIVLFNIFFSGCKKDPAGPEDSPGRRDYTWTIDSVYIPMSFINALWGSSPDDIWAISSWQLLHYKGGNWSHITINEIGTPYSIFGFSSNDIWIGNTDGQFWHFNGNNWSKVSELNTIPDKHVIWTGIWGESANNIYAVGVYLDSNGLFNNGVAAHYDGISWKILDKIEKKYPLNKIFKGKSSYKYFLDGVKWNPLSDSSFIYQFDGEKISVIYEGGLGVNDYGAISLVGDEILFTLGRKIAYWDGKMFKDITYIQEQNFAKGIMGRNRMDLFLWMYDGLAHFNGTDVKYLYRINANSRIGSQIFFTKAMLFTILDYNTGWTLIIKGELK